MCAWEFTKKCDSEEVVRIWGVHRLSKECGGAEWHFWKEKKWLLGKINGPLGEQIRNMIAL